MNYFFSETTELPLVSNSDSHSPEKIGREANIFYFSKPFGFKDITKKIRNKELITIEYPPELGKYHYTGHRKCNTCFSGEEALKRNDICPVCKKKMTIGVEERVLLLKDKEPVGDQKYYKLIPLRELFSLLYRGKSLKQRIDELLSIYKELDLLLFIDKSDLIKVLNKDELTLILNNRNNNIPIKPGCDGQYGIIGEKYSPPKSLMDFILPWKVL